MYVAWAQMIIGILILLAGLAAFVSAWRKIALYKAAGHGGGAWTALRTLGVITVLISLPVMFFATALGGAHVPLDRDTVDDLGSTYFNDNFYSHGQISKDGFDEWQRFVKPDYDNAEVIVHNGSSGEYCIRVTRQFGGQYGEDGHSVEEGYRPTDSERVRICIPVKWDSEFEDFEAIEPDEE